MIPRVHTVRRNLLCVPDAARAAGNQYPMVRLVGQPRLFVEVAAHAQENQYGLGWPIWQYL